MMQSIKKIVLTVVLIGMVVGMVILYFDINALQETVQKSFLNRLKTQADLAVVEQTIRENLA